MMSAEPNPKICVWCHSRDRELCVEECRHEGRYRNLEPATLANWELPPELPPFRELMDLPAIERLALIYLAVYYEQQERVRE